MTKWRWLNEEKIQKLRAQGQLPLVDEALNVRLNPHIVDMRLENGELVFFIDPVLHVKDEFELKADPRCIGCHGTGHIRYWYYQDESSTAPCYLCFPDNKRAVEERDRHARFTG